MIGIPDSSRFTGPLSRNSHEERSFNVAVECAGVARATCRHVSRVTFGSPQLTISRCCFQHISNDRQPACASWLTVTGGGLPVSIINAVGPASSLWYPECA